MLASMTFKPAAKGFRTMMGVSPEAAVKALKDAGADLVGCNCEVTGEPDGRPGAHHGRSSAAA